jgi:NAD(P)-dependent dehydrogenase (short-subunit alcohol dehydrogenase family)
MDKVWLVTGSASGLGRNIAEAVLESGDRLVGTRRERVGARNMSVEAVVDATII